MPQCRSVIRLVSVSAGTGIDGISLCRTGGFYDRFGIAVGMVDLLRNGFSRPEAVQIVAVGNVGVLILLPAACTDKSSSAGPAKGPIPTVVIGGGIAASVIGNGVAVISRQQVLPAGIPISVGMGLTAVRSGQDVPRIIIREGIGDCTVGGP